MPLCTTSLCASNFGTVHTLISCNYPVETILQDPAGSVHVSLARFLQKSCKISVNLQDSDSCNKKGPFLARILHNPARFLQDLVKFSGINFLAYLFLQDFTKLFLQESL